MGRVLVLKAFKPLIVALPAAVTVSLALPKAIVLAPVPPWIVS